MKKIFQYSLALLTAVVALASCSDSDDNYQGASVSGPQVFFSNTLKTLYEISPDANSFSVTISRGDTLGDLDVPLTVTQSEGSIFTVPSSVHFLDGQAEAQIPVSYNPADIVYGDYATINIAIADSLQTTPYGLSSYKFQAGVTAWVDYGTAVYREAIVSTWYNLGNPVYEVAIQRNTVRSGVYRLVNPYGAALGKALDDDEWLDSYDTTKDYYIEIDASDPDAVYVSESGLLGLTVDSESGMLGTRGYVEYLLKTGGELADLKATRPELFGKLEDGIITLPAKAMLISEQNYNNGNLYLADPNGLFAVALPGYAIADYSLEVAYVGRFTSADDVDYARLKFTFGADVQSVKYAVVEKDADTDAILAAIQDGTYEEAAELNANGTVEVALEETGTYQVVSVIYAGGEAVGTDVTSFKFKSSKDNAETWSPIYVGTYVYGAQSLSQSGALFYDQVYTDEGITLYQSDSDDTRYRIAPWCASEETGLVFTMDDETGELVVDGVETGEEDSTYGMIYATDVKTRGDANLASYYENGVFYFYLAYHVPAGVFAYELDTFTLTGKPSAPRKAAAVNAKHLSKKLDRKAALKGHKQAAKAVVSHK